MRCSVPMAGRIKDGLCYEFTPIVRELEECTHFGLY